MKISHNRKILIKKIKTPKNCSWKKRNSRSFNGKFLLKGIYKETVCLDKGDKEYMGLTGVSFKIRYNQHSYSIKNELIKASRLHYQSSTD